MWLKLSALLVTAGFLAACSPSDFFLGEDNRPVAKALPNIHTTLHTQVLWQDDIGEGGEQAGLALAPDGNGDTIYAVSTDGHLVAYKINTGAQLYSIDLDKNISAGVRYGAGFLLVATRNGELLALKAGDGSLAWRSNIGESILERPAIAGDMIIVRTSEGGVYAYSLNNGSQRWQYRISEPDLSVHGYAEPVVGGGVVILTTDGGRMIVLDQASGLPVAEQRIAVGQGYNEIQRLVDMDATPRINKDVLFGSAYQANTFALDLKQGNIIWTQPGISTAQDFAMSPDALFLHNDIDHMIALNQRDGKVLWRNDQLEGRHLSPVIAIPGRVATVDGEGYLHWLDITNGRLIGQTRIGDTYSLSEPYIGRDAIVWQLADGNIVAVRPQ